MIKRLVDLLFRINFKINFRITLLDRYIIKELIPKFLFSVVICSIVAEVVGISFEEIKFAIEEDLSTAIAVYTHWLKLPAFICIVLPFTLLISNLLVYQKLSNKNEIIALKSIGISLYRLIIPSLAIACVAMIFMFTIQEVIVPPANYEAAINLERELNVDRTQLAKYNKKEIIYQEFETEENPKHLKILFFAERFDGKKMLEITLLKFKDKQLRQIILARSAQWDKKQQKWQLFSGVLNILNPEGDYISTRKFEQLPLNLGRKVFDYVSDDRDRREMNIIELYRRLALVKDTVNTKKVREIEISIQQRYAAPVSCMIFTLLGSALGINSKRKAKYNSFTVATIVIVVYCCAQFVSTTLSISQAISIFWGVWFPNLLGLSIGYFILMRKN